MRVRVLALCAVLCAACAREPVEWVCPDAAPGELVITELRGPQSGNDTYGQWIELYNAGARTLDLTGLRLELVRLDGGAAGRILVREPVELEPGGYAVLGRFALGAPPAHVDYGWGSDFDRSLYDSAAVDLFACDTRLDRMVYRSLPGAGTWSLDGAETPDATRNDADDAWCADTTADPGDTTGLGLRGTPGAPNPPCL